MSIRSFIITVCVLLAGLSAGYFISRSASKFLEISYKEKDLSELSVTRRTADSTAQQLPLRIVDMGGVGVLPDTLNWGTNYEHNQHFFDDVMLVNPPFIDTNSFAREQQKLSLYAGKMASFGYNSIAIPWFLEFINFDGVGNGQQVYGKKSIYRQRHNHLSDYFGQLMEVAADSGLSTYLWTDMLALTPPLKSYLEQRFGNLDTENPELWEVYALAAEEAFIKFPQVDGMIIRIGEAGSVYNKPGWDYSSELYVRSRKAVRLMLEAFLTAAEKFDKNIIFRTWSVGVGQIGDMHTNPVTYQEVLGGISSDHLVVSTKYCSGDFYSWLNLNPTLNQGTHRRIIEMQAKREFEGFGAIPNYVASLHQSALQVFLERNPKVEGVWLWTQYGGPLRAGPMIIYPFYGFNLINEVNVYATSRIMMDPYANLDSISAEWISDYFGPDSSLVANLTRFLNDSYEVMRSGLYIGEFAKYEVRALGLEPPPMLWIFEWDILGASSSIFSNLYYITKDHFDAVIDEGFLAVKQAIGLKDLLMESRGQVSRNLDDYDRLIVAVEYEIELFRLLDYYRQFFMNYYHWLESGEILAQSSYKIAMGQFKAVLDYHHQKFNDDLNTLGFDFEEVDTGIRVIEKIPDSVRWARVVIVIILFLLMMGIPGIVRDRAHRKFAGSLYFDTLFRTYLISRLSAYHSSARLAFFMVILYVMALVIFSSFTSLLFPLCLGGFGLGYALILSLFLKRGRDFGRIFISIMAPKLIIMVLLLALVAVRGPMFFWYQFWVSPLFKLIFISAFVMLLFRKFQIYFILGRKWSHRNNLGSLAQVFLVLGLQLLLVGLALQFFGLEESLTALNNELLILPGGLSKIMGLTTHLGIPLQLPIWIVYIAGGISGLSFIMFLFNRKAVI